MIHPSTLKIDPALMDLCDGPLLDGLDISPDAFWNALSAAIETFAPRNRELLETRAQFQAQITRWHGENPEGTAADYRAFLETIGYLVPEPAPFTISPQNIDQEIAQVAGPQLVVPVMNARYALNAANARWGSLYDALYGTDAIDRSGDLAPGKGYSQIRGAAVIKRGRAFLDQAVPLRGLCHGEVSVYDLNLPLANPSQLVGYRGSRAAPSALLLQNNGLHIEVLIDACASIGASDKAGVADIIVESALSTIQDCEDSVAAVDGDDKALVYANWLGLMRGDLQTTITKAGRETVRTLAPNRDYLGLDDAPLRLPGRALLLVRNVGHLMTTPAVLDAQGAEVPEGILDAYFTVAAALHDVQRAPADRLNSRAGSIYIVKPKMHGPEEVAFACALFAQVERDLGLPMGTVKIGLMDEERRTTLNLPACIAAAQDRIFFINTGFLDRTGDEIHTSMAAGPMVPKTQMKAQPWIAAYEDWNVEVGLACGFAGRAQIGKGMWPKPDEMAGMMAEKRSHPAAGASTAWVPSPTAATLHALHYHEVKVGAVQAARLGVRTASRDTLLQIPLAADPAGFTAAAIAQELDNNAQSLLGYVVRWIDQGVGCSKVPDIHNVGLMEDRATLRISAQHMANWLAHGIATQAQVLETLTRMAAVVDAQNADDAAYSPMCANLEGSIAFQAARDLVFKGAAQPSGYTEPLLHAYRLKAKAA